MKFGYYGNFSNFWNTEEYIANALERAGYIVYRRDRNNTTLIDCDYILFARLYKSDIIIKARKQGIPTISWSFDLLRGYLGFNLPHLKADVVITTDPDDGFHTIRQGVHKPEKIMIEGKKIYDVVFVGNPNYYKLRKKMIKRVKPKIFNNVRGLALNKLLGQSKIVIGDSYPASNYWSNRIYETTGRGGFFIHTKVEGMPNYVPQFEYGKEKELIEYFLENEGERENIRDEQFEKCPTYDDRIKELIELIKKKEGKNNGNGRNWKVYIYNFWDY